MFEAKLTIEAPGLTNAINRLADAIAYSHAPAAIPSANPTPGQTAVPTGAPAAPATAQPSGVPAPAAPMTGPAAAPSNPANPTQGAGYASTAPTGAPAAPMAGPTSAFPSNTYPGQAPGPVSPTAPTAPPAQPTGVPLAPAPQYTVDQIMQAGATLMDAGKVNELMNLLHSFGVQAVMDLKPEQLGAFATAMRELGAKI